ncbi:REP-associated tyrosine transposase [Jannaschia sp. M317]|uniref:REP-associated tyrosine transposase n=1 Tax=Jannaschia sp. M317 TaxID=2867011 RepID=UPI0021A6CC38|nr:transposase [Jannaschia sp. M317]UWQ18909.1 transposase [Jannaschia sp. M317]
MPRYTRPRLPGATIFFTVCLADRESDLLVRHVDVLRAVVRRTRADRGFHIDAWVTLPDHFHAVLTLRDDDADYPNLIGAVKARFSRELRRAGFTPPSPSGPMAQHLRPGETGIWQRRFWDRHVRDVGELNRLVAYCHRNPVRHGLVADPFDWPYSSIHRDMRATLRKGAALAATRVPRADLPRGLVSRSRRDPLGEPDPTNGRPGENWPNRRPTTLPPGAPLR